MHRDGTVPIVAVACVGTRYDIGTRSFLVIGSSTHIHFSDVPPAAPPAAALLLPVVAVSDVIDEFSTVVVVVPSSPADAEDV